MTAVDKPLLVPTASQDPVSHSTEHPRKVRPGERAEVDLGLRAVCTCCLAWVRRRADGVKYKERHEILLIEHVRVGPGGEVSSTMHAGILSVLIFMFATDALKISGSGSWGGTDDCLLLRLAEQSSGRGNPDVFLVLYTQSVASIAGRLMSFALML